MPPFLREEARGVEIVPPLTELDLAAVEAAEPDLILGAKEFDEELYEDLSRIAPTVMTEGQDWKLNLRLHGEALGRTNDAERLLIDWDNRVARVRRLVGDRDLSVVLVAEPAGLAGVRHRPGFIREHARRRAGHRASAATARRSCRSGPARSGSATAASPERATRSPTWPAHSSSQFRSRPLRSTPLWPIKKGETMSTSDP